MEIIPKAQGSSSVNGREKYSKSINFTIQTVQWSHRPVVYVASLFALEEVGVQVQILTGQVTSSFFFFFVSFF